MHVHRNIIIGSIFLGMFSAAMGSVAGEPSERWTLSTQAGTATLALLPAAGTPPLIMFICGVRFPGAAQVIISNLDPALTKQRLRIDLASGQASAMTSGERAADPVRRQIAVLGEISIEQISALMRSRSFVLGWRVDASNSFQRPYTVVPMPPSLSKYRTEFLRFCA